MDNNQWESVIKNAVSNLGMCGKVCKTTLEAKDITEILNKFEDCAKQYSKLDIEHEAIIQSLSKTQDYFLDKENDLKVQPKKIFDKFLKDFSKANNKSTEEHALLARFHQELEGNLAQDEEEEDSNEDDDIVSNKNFVPPTDPISKSLIRHPVRNTECGHVYERDSINATIAQKNTRCPYIGCPARGYIQEKNLINDDELKRKIDKYFIKL